MPSVRGDGTGVFGSAVMRALLGPPEFTEAIAARDFTYFPPLGRRSNGGGQAFDAAMWGGVPGGYRATANDNIILVLMIETLEGVKNATPAATASSTAARPAAARVIKVVIEASGWVRRLTAGSRSAPARCHRPA